MRVLARSKAAHPLCPALPWPQVVNATLCWSVDGGVNRRRPRLAAIQRRLQERARQMVQGHLWILQRLQGSAVPLDGCSARFSLRGHSRILMVRADRNTRNVRLAIRAEKDGGVGPGMVEQSDVLRHRDRNALHRSNSIFNVIAGLEDVAHHQNHREPDALRVAATKGHAGNQTTRIHAIKAASPRPLALGDDLLSEPRAGFKAIRNNLWRKVIVAHQSRAL